MRLGFASRRVINSTGHAFAPTTALSSAGRRVSPAGDAAASSADAFALGIVKRPRSSVRPSTLQFACALIS